MNKITAAIIEDELPANRLLNNMIKDMRPEWEILTLPGSIEESVEWYNRNPHPDILFLDIQLTDGNSFLFIEQAQPASLIVFTTAYDEYAIRAFTVNSIDYLLKPIRRERLQEAIIRFERLYTKLSPGFHKEQVEDILQIVQEKGKKYRSRVLVSAGDKFFALSIDEIAYFYSENKCTFAVTGQKEHLVEQTLEQLSSELDPDIFFRTNRQTVLKIGAIQRVEPYFQNRVVVHVEPPFKEQIIVSREKVTAFKQWLNY